jgi:hypothetical protein
MNRASPHEDQQFSRWSKKKSRIPLSLEAGLFESKNKDSLRMCSPGGVYKGGI